MPSMKLDAVSVSSSDFAKTAKFYALLGYKFPDFAADAKHLEPITADGEVRLMIDDKDLIKSILGQEPRPPTHSSFAMKCSNPAGVDAAVKKIKSAGFTIVKEPWDAFWGQRYAIVADPDGYLIDLFAPLT
jgi:catechol 2,3-dioxygenase-like lactoylglutathione lyase family enzyme